MLWCWDVAVLAIYLVWVGLDEFEVVAYFLQDGESREREAEGAARVSAASLRLVAFATRLVAFAAVELPPQHPALRHLMTTLRPGQLGP